MDMSANSELDVWGIVSNELSTCWPFYRGWRRLCFRFQRFGILFHLSKSTDCTSVVFIIHLSRASLIRDHLTEVALLTFIPSRIWKWKGSAPLRIYIFFIGNNLSFSYFLPVLSLVSGPKLYLWKIMSGTSFSETSNFEYPPFKNTLR